jgi:hypothetical protein
MGISHDPLSLEGISPTLWPGHPEWQAVKQDNSMAVETLWKTETLLAQSSMEIGFFDALMEMADQNLRVLRDHDLPAAGIAQARQLLISERGPSSWQPDDVVVSESSEIAFSYGMGTGEYEGQDLDFAYTRIWSFDGEQWRVASDIRTWLAAESEDDQHEADRGERAME